MIGAWTSVWRKAWRWASAALFAVGVTAAAAALGTLADRHHARFDLTAGGAHSLGPRARRTLDGLGEDVEIVMALPREGDRRRSIDRVGDVLDAFASASPRVRVTRLDPSAADGRRRLRDLLDRLEAREADAIEAGRASVRRAAERTRALSEALLELRGEADRGTSVLLRALARELRGLASRAEASLAGGPGPRSAVGGGAGGAAGGASREPDAGAGPPDPAAAAAPLRAALAELVDRLDSTARRLRTTGDQVGGEGLARRLGALSDRAAAAREGLSSVRRPDAARVWDRLSGGEALLVLGEPGRGHSVEPIDPQRVLPDPAALRAAGVSTLPRVAALTEQVVGGAIAAVARDDTPILIVAHAETASDGGRLSRLSGRLRRVASRGVDAVGWNVVTNREPPPTSELDPRGTRPVVCVALTPDTTAFGGDGPSGSARAEALAEAVRRMEDDGAGVLLSLGPSYLPTIGDTDPLAALAERYGVSVRSGRVLLRERATPQRGGVIEAAVGSRGVGDHPIARAVGPLPVRLVWATPVTIETVGPGVRAWPLLEVAGDGRTWAETQWLGMWRGRRAGGAGASNAASSGASFEEAGPGQTAGPWVVAAAGERDEAGLDRPSRVVVVGAWGWADDGLWAASTAIGGRVVRTNPGNIELIEASIEWLAGREALIARGSAGPPISRVRPLSADEAGLIRWVLLGGVPGGVLVGWGLVRLLGG